MRKGTVLILSAAVGLACFGVVQAGDDKACSGCPSGAAVAASAGTCDVKTEPVVLKDEASKQFDAIKALAGTWESTEKGPDGKTAVCELKVTSNGSVVHETMFPGTDHEMINMYHLDNDKLIITHYCSQGIQPRMNMASVDGNKTSRTTRQKTSSCRYLLVCCKRHSGHHQSP